MICHSISCQYNSRPAMNPLDFDRPYGKFHGLKTSATEAPQQTKV